MNVIVKDRAVVLKTYEYGESSVIAVALTRAHGKLRFLAKGARRPHSPLRGGLCPGGISEAVFYFRAEGGLQLIKECGAADIPASSADGLERLCIFQAGLEIVDRAAVGRDADERLFDLVEAFMRLVTSAADPWALFYALEIGVLSLAGSFPSIAACADCGTDLAGGRLAVDPASGRVSCHSCRRGSGRTLSAGSSAALLRLEREGFRAAERAPLGREERREIGELLHRLFAGHVEGYRLPNALRLCKGVNGQ
jgi:DNA repair protein RecO (recombination protein O)